MFDLWPELQKIPYLKKAASEVLARRFDDAAIQRKEVRGALLQWYGGHPEEKPDPALLEQAAEQVQEIYSRNVWPRMNIGWGTYPNHIGHTRQPGMPALSRKQSPQLLRGRRFVPIAGCATPSWH